MNLRAYPHEYFTGGARVAARRRKSFLRHATAAFLQYAIRAAKKEAQEEKKGKERRERRGARARRAFDIRAVLRDVERCRKSTP